MGKWTESERSTIQSIFSKISSDVVGPAALSRCLIVYPWTQRYFGCFGNLYNAAAITSNPRGAAHGKVVFQGLEKGLQDMDNIKAAYAELSVLHSEELQVDPGNFKLLADCLTIVIAAQLETYGRRTVSVTCLTKFRSQELKNHFNRPAVPDPSFVRSCCLPCAVKGREFAPLAHPTPTQQSMSKQHQLNGPIWSHSGPGGRFYQPAPP